MSDGGSVSKLFLGNILLYFKITAIPCTPGPDFLTLLQIPMSKLICYYKYHKSKITLLLQISLKWNPLWLYSICATSKLTLLNSIYPKSKLTWPYYTCQKNDFFYITANTSKVNVWYFTLYTPKVNLTFIFMP